MTDDDQLDDRLAAVEDILVDNHWDARLARFSPMYAALTVAIVVLAWFPLFRPEKFPGADGTVTYGPAIGTDSDAGFTSIFLLLLFLAPMLPASLSSRLRNPAAPIVIAVLSAFMAVCILLRVGTVDWPQLTGTGDAVVAVLLLTVLISVPHAAVLFKYRALNRMQREPDEDEEKEDWSEAARAEEKFWQEQENPVKPSPDLRFGAPDILPIDPDDKR